MEFESLTLSLVRPNWKTQKPTDFFSDLVLTSDQITIVCDFNIHIDAESDRINRAFNLLLDSNGFSKVIKEPTHHFNYTLDLVQRCC